MFNDRLRNDYKRETDKDAMANGQPTLEYVEWLEDKLMDEHYRGD
jgi:hypothetical protein